MVPPPTPDFDKKLQKSCKFCSLSKNAANPSKRGHSIAIIIIVQNCSLFMIKTHNVSTFPRFRDLLNYAHMVLLCGRKRDTILALSVVLRRASKCCVRFGLESTEPSSFSQNSLLCLPHIYQLISLFCSACRLPIVVSLHSVCILKRYGKSSVCCVLFRAFQGSADSF